MGVENTTAELKSNTTNALNAKDFSTREAWKANAYQDFDKVGESYDFISQLKYLWITSSEAKKMVYWDEAFFPQADDTKDEYHYWKTNGAQTSPPYLLDTQTSNNGDNGSYYVSSMPVDTVQIEAFIPQEYVTAPYPYDFPFNGNYKKNPLDGSFTTGSSVFIKDAPGELLKFKLFQKAGLTTFASSDQTLVLDNSGGDYIANLESSSNFIARGETLKYDRLALHNGHLLPGAKPIASAIGNPTSAVLTAHPKKGEVRSRFRSSASDPLVPPAQFAPVDWDLSVTIDRSSPTPTWRVQGTHKQYPAYVVFINGVAVYEYDPILYECQPFPGLLRSQSVDISGGL